VISAVDSATVIEIGDLLWLDGDDVKPAGDFTWDTDLATTQPQFARRFAGLALQASAAGETKPVRVALLPIAEFPCASAAFEVGDLVGPDDNAAPDGLLNQQVIAVATPEKAIGKVVKREAAASTSVTVMLAGALLPLGRQRMAETVFHADAGVYAAGGDIVTNYTFGRPVKVTGVIGIVTTATTGAATVTLKNGADSLDDTLTIPDGSVVGAVVEQAVSDANGYDYFEANDQLDITGDGTPTAGAVDIMVRFIEL